MEILSLFAISLIAFVSLALYELRRREPLLEVRFFRSAPFSGASVIAVCAFASLGGYLFLNTLYLQEVRGHSPLQAGLYMLPIAGMTVICAPISGRIVGSRGARGPLIVGGCGMAISSAIMTGLSPTTPVWVLLLTYVIFGIGFGTVNPPITNTAVVGMPPSQAGVAAAIASTSRQVGQTLGVAVVGALAAGAATSALAVHHLSLSDVGWWVVLGCGLAVLALGVLSTTRRARLSATRVAESFGEMGEQDPTRLQVQEAAS
jgi:MFS family permease